MYDPATPQFLEQVGLDLSENSESKEQNKGKSGEIHPKLMSILLYNSLKNSYGTGAFVPVHGHGGVEAYRASQEECEILRECVPYVNPLKTKRRPLYLKAQSVPRCKHFSSRL